VPFLLQFPGCTPSGPESFSEAQADSTGLMIDEGHALLPWILRQSGAAK
jgi:2,3-bisphosphoglycerate-independent phosphoglycerate mutase